MISKIFVKLEKQESTTTVQGNHVPEAQFSKFCKNKIEKRERREIATWEITTTNRPKSERNEPTWDAEEAIIHQKRCVYNGKLDFTSEKASIQNYEAYAIIVVETDGRSKTTKSPTGQISTYQSVGLTGAKNRVSDKEAPELRLSRFQSRRGLTGR